MQAEPRPRFYHPELDGLRFIAFLLVYIHNSPFIESIPFWKALNEYGWIGVDLFFCLSAFLITKLLITEYQQAGRIDTSKFYMRRILRIWPLYFIYIVIALSFTIQAHGWSDNILKHMFGLVTFTFNFTYFFLFYNIIDVFIHLWTISYEEQFYAVIPWLMKKLGNSPERAKWNFLIGVLLFGNLIRAVFVYLQIRQPAIYMLPFTHFEAMLGGVAIGLGLFDDLLKKVRGWVLLLAGVVCNLMAFYLPNIYEIGWTLFLTYSFTGLGMSLIVFTVIRQDRPVFVERILRNSAICYLGKISYGLYMFHILSNNIAGQITTKLLGIMPEQTEAFRYSLLAIGFSMTIILAVLSYHLLERPFLRMKERISVVYSRPI